MRAVLVKGVRNAIVVFLLVVAAYVYGKPLITLPPDPDAAWKQHYSSQVAYDHRDECWSGPRPSWAPEVPTHVIMRVEDGIGGGHWQYLGGKWVDIALNDTFTKDNPRVFVQAFCA